MTVNFLSSSQRNLLSQIPNASTLSSVSLFPGTKTGGWVGTTGKVSKGSSGNWRRIFVYCGIVVGTGLILLATFLYARLCASLSNRNEVPKIKLTSVEASSKLVADKANLRSIDG